MLPVARHRDPCSRQAAISSKLLTSASVTPARVIPPLVVSRICMGGLPTASAFKPPPNTSSVDGGLGSSRS